MLINIEKRTKQGVTASEISVFMKVDRANVSRALNQLCHERSIEKIAGRPVIFKSICSGNENNMEDKKSNAYTARLMWLEE